jgi:hypothetical protein
VFLVWPLLQDAEDALSGARGRAEEAAKRIAREEVRVAPYKPIGVSIRPLQFNRDFQIGALNIPIGIQ